MQSDQDREAGEEFINNLKNVIETHIDPNAVDREGEIEKHVLEELAKIKAFAIKIPQKYEGLGLSPNSCIMWKFVCCKDQSHFLASVVENS